MRCPNCGQRLADEAGRCPVCGTVIDEETRRQAMNEDDFASSSFEGTRQSMGEQASAAQSGRTDQMAPDEKRYTARPMKWYKFLIYFSLVLTGFANIWTGVEAVLGMQYETKSQAAQVYTVYPGLHVLDIIYGVLLVNNETEVDELKREHIKLLEAYNDSDEVLSDDEYVNYFISRLSEKFEFTFIPQNELSCLYI